jgi:hypothetical protein
MLLSATAGAWLASLAIVASSVTAVLIATRAAAAQRGRNVNPLPVIFAASIIGGSVSAVAAALLSS